MGTILSDLYNGNTEPWMRKRTDTTERLEAEEEFKTEMAYWRETLSKDDYRRLDNLVRLYLNDAVLEEEASFAVGVRFGIRFMLDVLTTGVTP